MTHSEIIRRVRAYVDENFLYAQGSAAIADDASLLALGVIDSLGVIELLMFLEQEYGVLAADDEITETNLGTFRGIAAFVLARRGASHYSVTEGAHAATRAY
jgi:acyl carrier protein